MYIHLQPVSTYTLIRKFELAVKWPKTVSNEALYAKTNDPLKWSKKITGRRLSWFGKIANFQEDIPAKRALRYALENYKKPPGRPKTTWISKVKKDLIDMNLSWLEAENLAKENFSEWQQIVIMFVKNTV